MDYTKYHDCLRLQITMDDNADARIEEAVAHCAKYGFDNVMLMLNAEEFHLGHITLEEAKPWVELLKRAKVKFEKAGIVVSLNHWIEIGHLARGRKLKEGQNFTTMVDRRGAREELVACPIDEEWLRYHTELVSYFVKELQPDTYWIEDDFRLHNHGAHEGVGCFCEKHMALYNQALGTKYTREEFVKKAFAKGVCNRERKAWLDVNRRTMVYAMERLTKAIKEACPKTEVGLMSSAPGMHALEARDWESLFRSMEGNTGRRINRIHLPQYFETSGKDFLYDFNRWSMMIRALSGNDCIVMPETENGNANLVRKSPRFMQFTLEGSIPLVLSGMTYSIYDFVGNGVRESMGFAQVVHGLRPYMQAVEDEKLRFDSLQGVILPIDENASYKRSINEGDLWDLTPREGRVASYLSALGISYRYSKEKTFRGETVFLCGSVVDYLTDEEVRDIFKNDYVLVDGSGALALFKRNLLSLIGAERATLRVAETGYQSYEECTDGTVIDGIKNLRASCRLAAGDFVEIEYTSPVTVHTKVFDHTAKALAPAIVEREGIFVLPYCLEDNKLWTQFCDLRKHFVIEWLKKKSFKGVICSIDGVSSYYYDGERKHLILVNGNVDTYEKVGVHLPAEVKKIFRLRKDGSWREVDYERKGAEYSLSTELEYLSSAVFRLK